MSLIVDLERSTNTHTNTKSIAWPGMFEKRAHLEVQCVSNLFTRDCVSVPCASCEKGVVLKTPGYFLVVFVEFFLGDA
jgi:hypothetical protein